MKKFLKLIAIVLILMTCLSGCANLNIKDWAVKKQAINYLCEKYDAEPDEFELVDYEAKHIYWQEYEIFLLKPVEIDYSFEFVYNNRHFIVHRDGESFYDDYQIEDIELWCTEWLQENVDERIIAFDIWTDNILKYYESTNKDYNYVIKKEDAEEYLKNHETSDIVETYYHNDVTIESFGSDENLANKIKSSLSLQRCYAGYSDKQFRRDLIKGSSGIWDSIYTFVLQ